MNTSLSAQSAQEELTKIVDKIEGLESEKSDAGEYIREAYANAKSNGFDPKIIRKIISIRKKGKQEYAEEQALVKTYLDALS